MLSSSRGVYKRAHFEKKEAGKNKTASVYIIILSSPNIISCGNNRLAFIYHTGQS